MAPPPAAARFSSAAQCRAASIIRGGRGANADSSLVMNIILGEKHKVQLQGEAFSKPVS
ncbi:MAG: hypothetical protein ABSC08_12910 [Bryobacteraceae bacterium]